MPPALQKGPPRPHWAQAPRRQRRPGQRLTVRGCEERDGSGARCSKGSWARAGSGGPCVLG